MDRTWEKGCVQLSGSEIGYVTFGKGSRNLVVFPELNYRRIWGSGPFLARKYQMLGENWRVYFLDVREELPENCTVHDLAGDAAEAMRNLGINRADVLGISLGGMIAQVLALEHPELVGKLILTVTLSRPNTAIQEAVERWSNAAASGDYESVARDMLVSVYSKDFARRYEKAFPLTAHLEPLRNPRQFVRLARACCTCDTLERLSSLRCPVLVIGGRQDCIVTGEASVEMAKRLNCQLYMYEDLGHSVFEEGTDFVQRVYTFLMENEKTKRE